MKEDEADKSKYSKEIMEALVNLFTLRARGKAWAKALEKSQEKGQKEQKREPGEFSLFGTSGFLHFQKYQEYTDKLLKEYLFLKGSNSFEKVYSLVSLRHLCQNFQNCERRLYKVSPSRTNKESFYQDHQISELCILVWSSIAESERKWGNFVKLFGLNAKEKLDAFKNYVRSESKADIFCLMHDEERSLESLLKYLVTEEQLKKAPEEIKARFFVSMKPGDRSLENLLKNFVTEEQLKKAPRKIKAKFFESMKPKDRTFKNFCKYFYVKSDFGPGLNSLSDPKKLNELKELINKCNEYKVSIFLAISPGDGSEDLCSWRKKLFNTFFRSKQNNSYLIQELNPIYKYRLLKQFAVEERWNGGNIALDLLKILFSNENKDKFVPKGMYKNRVEFPHVLRTFFAEGELIGYIPYIDEIPFFIEEGCIKKDLLLRFFPEETITVKRNNKDSVWSVYEMALYCNLKTMGSKLMNPAEVHKIVYRLNHDEASVFLKEWRNSFNKYPARLLCLLRNLELNEKLSLLKEIIDHNPDKDITERFLTELLEQFFPRDYLDRLGSGIKIHIVWYLERHTKWLGSVSVTEHLFNKEELKNMCVGSKATLLDLFPSGSRFRFITEKLFTKNQLRNISDHQKITLLKRLKNKRGEVLNKRWRDECSSLFKMMYTSESFRGLQDNKREEVCRLMEKTKIELEGLFLSKTEQNGTKQNLNSINDSGSINNKDQKSMKNPVDIKQEDKSEKKPKPIFITLNYEIDRGSNGTNKNNIDQEDIVKYGKGKTKKDEEESLLNKKFKRSSNDTNGSNTNQEDVKERKKNKKKKTKENDIAK